MVTAPAFARHRPARTLAWLALVALTLISLGLGEWGRTASWLPLLVAAIVWIKGTLVARHFIEVHLAHPFIAGLLRVFIALPPIALLVTSYLGQRLVS